MLSHIHILQISIVSYIIYPPFYIRRLNTHKYIIYSFFKTPNSWLKINLGNFLRKWQMYENGHYFPLTVIFQALTTLSGHTGSRVFARQLARSLTRRPATFLTIVSLQQSARDSTSFTSALVKTHPLSLYCLNCIFRRKKNHPKNPSWSKIQPSAFMLRGTREKSGWGIFIKIYCREESISFWFCALFYNCLALFVNT